ncbi:LLM class flavin-dependent oxidoreductase [Saccharopolyspora sp. SCSIO 74807]|uniref:LLM class flavin-dependent oxidoreductase n=1 Tax=Saccharopolyspora sp. SCSIO 74807 TaxID=3118084 RepID=UPI0030CEB0F5
MRIHGDAVRFGIHSGQQYSSFPEALQLWQEAEELGYDWVSLFDHFRPPLGGPGGPCFEGPTLLSALAARTSRVRCGMLVLAAHNRHPAMVASIASTLDHVSGGRLELGLGAGGADLAHEQYGWGAPNAGTRMDVLDETCRIVRALTTERVSDIAGEHFRLAGAHLEPKPVQRRLPLVIGGAGERRTLRIVAEHADVWNSLPPDPAGYEHKLGVLDRHCRAAGRAPEEIRTSITFRAVLGADVAEARRNRDAVLRRLPSGSPDRHEYLCFGTPKDCVRELRRYADLGVRDFLLGVRPPIDWRTVELMATEVAPELR